MFEGDVIVVEDEKNVGKGRNRQALGDIGNVARGNYSKNEPSKINRPRTRSQHVPLVEVNLKVCSFFPCESQIAHVCMLC